MPRRSKEFIEKLRPSSDSGRPRQERGEGPVNLSEWRQPVYEGLLEKGEPSMKGSPLLLDSSVKAQNLLVIGKGGEPVRADIFFKRTEKKRCGETEPPEGCVVVKGRDL